MADRHAAEMRADADDDQPFGLLHARLVGGGIGQIAQRDRPGLVDFLLRAMVDEDRLARHFTVTICPTGILLMSTSVVARASVEASGFI